MKRKYNYLKVIQQNFGQGWEDVSSYECNSYFISSEKSGVFYTDKHGRKREYYLFEHDLKEYRFTGYPTRVIFRREKSETN